MAIGPNAERSCGMQPEDHMPQGSCYIQAEDCRGAATAFLQKDGSKCCNAANHGSQWKGLCTSVPCFELGCGVGVLFLSMGQRDSVSCALHWAISLVSLSCCRASHGNSIPCFPIGCMHGVPLRIASHEVGVP